jgi:hypothetical protein
MPDAAIDACCLIDLLASGNLEAILCASGLTWHLPSAVRAEVQYRRQHDPARPGKTVNLPVDLSALISLGVLKGCDPQNQQEIERFTHYAALFRADGEAMCLALAEQRRWILATDDRRAIKVAKQVGLTVMSCPEIVKAWPDTNKLAHTALRQVLHDIQVLAQFKPSPNMPERQWWLDELARSGP